MGQDAWRKCRILLFTKGWLAPLSHRQPRWNRLQRTRVHAPDQSSGVLSLWMGTSGVLLASVSGRFHEPADVSWNRTVCGVDVTWNRWLTMLRTWSWFGANCWLISLLSTCSSGSLTTSDSICGRLSLRTWALLPTAISDIGRNWSTSHVAYDASLAGFE